MKLDISIKHKLMAIGLFSVALLCAVGLMAYMGISRLTEANQASARYGDALRHQLEVDMMHDALRGDVLAARLAVASQDGAARGPIEEDLAAHVRNLQENFGKLAALDLDDDAERVIKDVRTPLDGYTKSANEIVRGAFAGDGAEIPLDRFNAAFESLEAALGEVSDAIASGATRKRDAAEEQARGMSMLTLGTVGVLAPVLLLATFLTGLGITRRIAQLRSFMDGLAAGEADLTKRLAVQGRDEMAATAVAFNAFMAMLEELVAKVRKDAGQLAGSARELAAAATRVSGGSAQQTDATASIAAAIEEVTESIACVSRQADDVRGLSQKGCERTGDGRHSLSEMVEDIGRVERAVAAMANAGEQFIRSVAAITGMTQQVKEIAEQTNLLALNAAIEAARAGEQGRGFAVVADEVRKLAERSAASAGDIDSVTGVLSTHSDEMGNAIKDGRTALHACQDQVQRVVTTLSGAESSVQEAGAGVDAITLAVKEQTTASNDIARNVEKVARMVEENHAAIRMTADSAASMEQLAGSLHYLVGRFRIAS